MQHSPQDIKSRLDRAVDPEGNVLDMAAVLELVTTLERLPITREALETTRIGKTINLLRKKTNNEVLAKRAKKLVKKWQKLVINQIEATRNVDSPINGSRISSPQINGTLSESEKPSTPSLTDKTVKSITINDYKKKGLKRKHSSSSSGNSPLTVVETSTQDSITSFTPNNSTNDSQSLVPSNGSSSNNEFIQSKDTSSTIVHKKPKLMDDEDNLFDEKDGMSLKPTSESSSKHINNSGNSDNNSVGKDNVGSDDINIIGNADNKQDCIIGDSVGMAHNVNNSVPRSDKANFSNVNDSACTEDDMNNICSVPVEGQNHSTLTQKENTNIKHLGMAEEIVTEQDQNGVDIKGSETVTNSQKNTQDNDYNRLPCSMGQKDSDMCTSSKEKHLDNEHCVSTETLLDSTGDSEQSQTANEMTNQLKETLPKTPQESESIPDDSPEPKELVLDMNEEANGINGRYNDNGTWYSWTDVMPYNDGVLNILPYVILD